ncbi:Lovastatin diketide synthase LovF [Penicillium bovifimosum]|uniref:Lovastatin diketide synthase LovF n=1 Tax=Penicillium bovifimosum TaxID=126998 RepID=A0A9W9L446_9EURO|nr:Lovastatin diketide synthase LovF [Penicillium bovifimosum]KAJ5135407.1 Lovastatin diketide synthase LovF [Penicillium bovifimosum]
MDFSTSDKQEPIAIVGAACRFAGEVSSLESLWDMISKVKTGHGPVPSDRWDSKMWHHPDPDRKGGISPQHGYFLEQDISHFDAPFFSVTAKEAASMDPMKRMLLEVCYESFENGRQREFGVDYLSVAGIPVEDLMDSRTGCYVGCMTNDYEMISLHDIYNIGHPAATGLSEAMTANRVSWFFGLKGPSLTLDTACSSSLYALHLACQSLRLRETNMSLITGVNLMINPNTSHQLTAMHMLSAEGISHTFDDRANGYGRGDGIGALVVKRLSDAIRDGDTIRAVIRGSGVNADGKTPSVTQPSPTAQAELIIQTYDDAGLDLSETGYFECHGTGTPVGDPLELAAIASTLGAARRAAGRPPLHIGSIKPSVGHTEGCAGLAGVFKSILLLEKGMLVPTYGVNRVNPKLKLSDWHLTLPEDVARWPTPGLRRISVNSFGFGGANAHVILDDAYHYLLERGLNGKHNTVIGDSGSDSGFEDTSDSGVVHNTHRKLFLFTGKDQTGAKRVSEALNAWLQQVPENKQDPSLLENLAFTLAQRRTHLEHRSFAIADSMSELTERLSRGLPAATRTQRHGENLVLVFTGQGAQWPAMGRELFENAIFRASIDASQSYLESFGCKWNAIEELGKISNPNVNLPEYSQPLCTVVQVALVDLLRFWKVLPKATIGHSSGEIVAAYAASLLTHHDAVKLAYVRGLSSAAVSKKGAMMAAGLSQNDAQIYLEKIPAGSAVIACINSPSSVTLSGDVDAIDQLEALISSDGKFARKLKVTTAYHSPHMREVEQKYLDMIGEIIPMEANETDNSPVMYSSLTGSIVSSAKELNAQYWVDNMQSPVNFSQALLALLKHKRVAPGGTRPVSVQWGSFLEVGPHAALQGPVRQIIDASNNKFAKSAPYASMLVRGKDATETALNAAGVLWAAGCKVDMAAVNQQPSTGSNTPQMLCDLPRYPWNYTRSYWHESYSSRSYRFPPHMRNDYLGMAEDSQNSHEPRWRNYLRISENPWIEDHTITGTVLYPGAGMLVMALEGALRTADSSKTIEGFRMTDVTFERGLVISMDEDAPVETRISFHPHSVKPDSWLFTVYSMSRGSPWAKHCAGTVAVVYENKASEVEDNNADALWQKQSGLRKTLLSEADSVHVNVDEFYKNLYTIGMQYGPSFRNVQSLTAVPSKKASYGSASVPDTKSTMPKSYETPHVIHPATMDSIFHLAIACLDAGQQVKQAAVPYNIEEIYVAHDQPKEAGALYSGYARLLSQNGHEITTELVVSDQEWAIPKLTVKNFALRQVTSGLGSEASDAASSGGAVKNCAGITWTPDLSFSASREHFSKLVLPGKSAALVDSWLNAVFLKTSNITALIVMFDESECSIDVLRRLRSHTYGSINIIALATSESVLQLMQNTLGEDNEKTTITYEWLSESQLLETLAPEANDIVIGLGVPGIAKHAATFAMLAPLACLTQAGQPDGMEIIVPGRECVGHLADDEIYVLFASSTSPPSAELPDSVVLLLPESSSTILSTFSATIQTKLERSGISVSQTHLTPSGVASLAGKYVISLLEIDNPLVYAWDEDQFNSFKTLISSVGHLFWITHGSVLESWSNGVEFATTQGLFRVMRNEYPIATLPTMDLSAVADISNVQYADLVLEVWRTSLSEDAEMEYAEGNGLIYIPRATEEADFDHELQLASNTAKPIVSSLGAAGKPLKASESANTQGYVWIADEQAESPLEADQVEIKVEYAGVGMGQKLNSVRHAVGIVTQISDSVKDLQLGQRAIVFSDATAKTHVRQSENLVVPLPDGLEPPEAVALVEPLVTAQYALIEIAHLSHGQALLLDDATSAVGQALVQVAKAVGADIFALVHSRAARDTIADRYCIPTDHIFDAALGNFVPLIQSATQNRGVDVVVSQQVGTHVTGAVSILSDFGQFVDMTGESSRALLPAAKTNATLARIDIATVIRDRPAIVSKLLRKAFEEYILQGPFPLTVAPAINLSASVNDIHTEQVVISLDDASPVLVPAPPGEELKLDGEAVYVLAGGLGALGLDIANWMVQCGAKNLAFLSRSAGAKNQQDLQKFTERSVRAEAFKCNITDAASVAKVFDSIKARGSRIAGVIQLAMVLEDGIFDNMSFDQWRHAIEPKTKGSRNLLANIWPGDKTFFILLSSITGVIGNTAQANYASGNTFEDALAHHAHTHLGINATSIDVGLVSDSSHFTTAGEFGDLASYLGRYQHGWRGLQTNLGELGVVIRAIMRRSTKGQRTPAQIILGLGDRIEHQVNTGGFSRDKKFELRVVKVDNKAGDDTAKQDVGTLLANATNMAEAAAAVEDNIKELVAAAMGVSLGEVDAQKPLYDYGVDSLQAVDIRNRALLNMRSDISVFDILSAMPLADVAMKIAAKSQLVKVTAGED